MCVGWGVGTHMSPPTANCAALRSQADYDRVEQLALREEMASPDPQAPPPPYAVGGRPSEEELVVDTNSVIVQLLEAGAVVSATGHFDTRMRQAISDIAAALP